MRRSILLLIILISAKANALCHDPAVSRTQVAFIHGGQVWIVPRDGGEARRITESAGDKFTPRFSPDGDRLAYSANEFRNMVNIYTVSVAGGSPRRITHLPSRQTLVQWTHERLLFYTNALSFSRIEMQLFSVSAGGGLPERLLPAYGAEGAIDESGDWLAYTPQWPNPLIQFWKHYRGGAAPDIWLLNLRTHQSMRITDWKGTDTRPMWYGRTLYYLSDSGPEDRLNLWMYDTQSGARHQVTHYRALDVREPSLGSGAIVFRLGSELHLLDLSSGSDRELRIVIPGHSAPIERDVDASKFITAQQVAGSNVLLEARGDLWIVASGKAPRNLTSTSGAFEREASLSPDGKQVAYFSDSSGEYQLYVHGVDGPHRPPVTHFTNGFRFRPLWSPDGRRLAFTDQSGAVLVADPGSQRVDRIDRDSWGELPELAWSADSRSLAYTLTGTNRLTSIWSYDLSTGLRRQVTSDRFNSGTPAFSPDGQHLFFISYRNFSTPTEDWLSQRIAYRGTGVIMDVPLAESSSAVDYERLAIRLPTTPGTITSLAVTAAGDPLFGLTDGSGARTARLYDMRKKSERIVVDGTSDFTLSSDGREILLARGGKYSLRGIDDPRETAIDTTMAAHIILREEWRELFNDAWRLYRDFFFAPKRPLSKWEEVRGQYASIVEHCVTRPEVNLVLSEMIGESSVGHAYIARQGDVLLPPTGDVGMLGADYAVHDGAFEITHIYEGGATDDQARSPLKGVTSGEYLLAVNGVPLDTAIDPRAAFVGLSGREVVITVGSRPAIDDGARKLSVVPAASENDLRYRSWVERNREEVEKASGGRIGYIHIPTFSTAGYGELVRQFYGQTAKESLIIDARWSEGGWVGGIAAELLSRPQLNAAAGRYAGENAWPVPRWGAHFGRKVLLVNHITVSAGENFASYFRRLKLGAVIGERTWGGLTGLNSVPALIDGGAVNVPAAPFFDETGWMIEGEGLVPDVSVNRDPADDPDPELRAAIAHLLLPAEGR